MASLAIAVGGAGCASTLDLPGYPLYPDWGRRLEAGEIARLYGPIAFVDERDVSQLGDALEIMPGCHRVRTRDDPMPGLFGRSGTGGRGVRFGPRSFVVSMKAGHTYLLRRLASSGNMAVFLEEHDATGAWSRDIRAGKGDAGVCENVLVALFIVRDTE